MEEYRLTVGLEIHAELSTRTKMFCDSKNDPDEERPNVNICPVCMGHPGTLPVINKEAVRSVLRLGIAVGGKIAEYTEFDRKNYFYPDIPKGYQISQYKHPLVAGGSLAGVELTRIHLEEDTASSTHDPSGQSLVNFNRAGAPLLELVTEPVIHDAASAARFARELQLLLIYLGISHANMEKGEMRVEANISVAKGNDRGTKVEVKNLNSFKAVEKAIEFEMKRHIELLERGESITQETRGWDENKEETFSQRQKEDSHDYRYFPDPDLPKLFISEIPEFNKGSLLSSLPELPERKRARLAQEYVLKQEDIEFLVRSKEWADFFETAASGQNTATQTLIANYLISDVKNLIEKEGVTLLMSKLTPESLAELMNMVAQGELSSRGGKDILRMLVIEGGNPRKIAETHNLFQKSDESALKEIAEKIISENEKAVTEYRNGKEASLQFLIGQGMKAMKGSANPQILKKIFEDLLK